MQITEGPIISKRYDKNILEKTRIRRAGGTLWSRNDKTQHDMKEKQEIQAEIKQDMIMTAQTGTTKKNANGMEVHKRGIKLQK